MEMETHDVFSESQSESASLGYASSGSGEISERSIRSRNMKTPSPNECAPNRWAPINLDFEEKWDVTIPRKTNQQKCINYVTPTDCDPGDHCSTCANYVPVMEFEGPSRAGTPSGCRPGTPSTSRPGTPSTGRPSTPSTSACRTARKPSLIPPSASLSKLAPPLTPLRPEPWLYSDAAREKGNYPCSASTTSFATASSEMYDGQTTMNQYRELDRELTVCTAGGEPVTVLYSKSQLGMGGQAVIYFGTIEYPAKLVAVKEFRPCEDDGDYAQTECEILESLQGHENIVNVVGTTREGTTQYLVTDLTSLDLEKQIQMFKRRGMPRRAVIANARGILKGLAYMHSKGVIHRDVKPSNILVSSEGKCLIADFGVAVRVADAGVSTGVAACVGTLRFTSPEAIEEKIVSYATDVWSLGCCILYMLTGILPWQREVEERNGGERDEFMVLSLVRDRAQKGPHESFRAVIGDAAAGFLDLCLTRDWTARPTPEMLLNHEFLK